MPQLVGFEAGLPSTRSTGLVVLISDKPCSIIPALGSPTLHHYNIESNPPDALPANNFERHINVPLHTSLLITNSLLQVQVVLPLWTAFIVFIGQFLASHTEATRVFLFLPHGQQLIAGIASLAARLECLLLLNAAPASKTRQPWSPLIVDLSILNRLFLLLHLISAPNYQLA